LIEIGVPDEKIHIPLPRRAVANGQQLDSSLSVPQHRLITD
jgi:hypothetical protein